MVRNVHERTIEAPAAEVGALLDRLSTLDDPLWPVPAWPPLRLDGPLAVGADGGHGPIRYRVSVYEPGRRVRFAFHERIGIRGHHELVVEPAGASRCVLRHVLAGQTRGSMRAAFPLVIRWLHDALIEDLLDRAELVATGRVLQPARWSPWVRLWRRLYARRSRRVVATAR